MENCFGRDAFPNWNKQAGIGVALCNHGNTFLTMKTPIYRQDSKPVGVGEDDGALAEGEGWP